MWRRLAKVIYPLFYLCEIFFVLPLAAQPLDDHQVYIWQRVWSERHAEALRESHDLFSGLRILVLQRAANGTFFVPNIDAKLLLQDKRPVWLVVRVDGTLSAVEPALIQQILRQQQYWQQQGIKLVGIEVDYDAPVSKLEHYQHFLATLRQSLPSTLSLSITALPAWITSADLPRVLQQTDSSVLQVHAVLSPDQGLFNVPQALQWVADYSRLTSHPFRVALPAYGMGLVRWDNNGPDVVSEVSSSVVGPVTELYVSPQTVADFLHQLRSVTPDHLQGIIWFRLPLAGDKRAWSLSTLRAVIQQHDLQAQWVIKLQVVNQTADAGSLYDVILSNQGHADAPLPQRIQLQAANCLSADSNADYELHADGRIFGQNTDIVSAPQYYPLSFERQRTQLQSAGTSRSLGWLRCYVPPAGAIHVEP